ncbi:MAG: hypothetical protein MJ178_10545 [Treponemataceae bacterium]|nr:hypothetical protein [Treponemataceae bacterium]
MKTFFRTLSVFLMVFWCTAVSMAAEDMTSLELFRLVNKTVIRSQEKLELMHKPNALSKLGSEIINGDVSGTLSYDAAMKGLGGRVIMLYKGYCDFSGGIVLTGDCNTTASMNMKGTMDGTVLITGPVTGAICYDNVRIVDGTVGGGYYLVSVNGGPYEKIDWKYALED